MPSTSAVIAAAFINSLGVNTHIDFYQYGYQNLSVVESSLKYIGVKNVRDSAQWNADLQTWPAVAAAAGVKFDDYMPEGSPATVQKALQLVGPLASTGILNFVEGGNEEDDAYAIAQGNTLAYTASFQQQVYQTGTALGLPVINMSFGAGWTAANNWHGDYDKVGDLSTYATYGNGHVYPAGGSGQPNTTILQLTADALLAAASRPVIMTEIGWNASNTSDDALAKYALDAVFDCARNGNPRMYFYALFDDGSGKFGLMNSDGTPKPAGAALHNLTTLLADLGPTTFTPGTLSYQFSGTSGHEGNYLIQKSDGSYWIAVWDEIDTAHTITMALDASAAKIQLFDPLTGTNSIQTINNAPSVTLSLTDHPILIKVTPAALTASAASSSGGTATPPAANVITSYANNSAISANVGTTAIYAYGTGNTITGGPATTTIQAFAGGNTITGGTGTTIRYGGGNNAVFVGSGNSMISDSGSNNTITFPEIGVGSVDIYGYVLDQGDVLNLKSVLSDTQWTGDPNTVGNFLKLTTSGSSTIVTVNPSGLASGATYPVATLHGYIYMTIPKLLAHASY